jgi:hypothetical protein
MISIVGSNRFDLLRSLHQTRPMMTAPQSNVAPIPFAGVSDRFQKGNPAASKAMPSKHSAPLTFSALQQHQLEHPDFRIHRTTLEPKANNPFKLAAGEPAHPIFAGQKNPALPTINYFSSKGNNRNVEPSVKSSSPSFAAIPAIAGLSMLFAQVLGPAITLLKSAPVLSAVSQVNPMPAIKALDSFLKFSIPRGV